MSESLRELSSVVATVGANFLIQSSVLIAAALLAARFLSRSAAVRSAIYRATLVAAIVSPLACYALDRAGFSFAMFPLPRSEAVSAEMPADMPLAISPAAGVITAVPAEASEILPVASAPPAPRLTAERVYLGIALLWAAGSGLLLGYLLFCHLMVLHIRRLARAVSDAATLGRLKELCARFNARPPRLLVSDRAKSPMLVGFARPAVVLPQLHEKELLKGAMDRVLIHEVAHLARRDCLWHLLARLLCAVAFFQPLAWLLARRLEEASDEVADDYVLSLDADGRSYARELADIAEKFLPTRREGVAGIGVIRFRSSLGRRVARILDSARELAVRISWKGVLAICAIAVGVTLLTACLSFSGRPAAAAPAQPGEANARHEAAPIDLLQPVRGTARPRSPRELELEKALDERIEHFSFEETPLGEVLNGFFKLLPQFENVNFVIAPGLERDILVTLEMKDVSLGDALNAMLRPRGLDFIVWSGGIYISSKDAIARIRGEMQESERRAQVQNRLQTQDKRKSEVQAKIEAALNEKIEAFSFEDTPLADVINFFKLLPEFKKVNFVVDTKQLNDRNVRITLTMNEVSLRSALRTMLEPQQLDFAILNDAIFISTKEEVRDRMPWELRIYDVRDLLRSSFASTIFNVTGENNWRVLEYSSQPAFQGRGKGWGNVSTESGLMVVNQRADVHDQIEAILEKLRAAQPNMSEAVEEENLPPTRSGRTPSMGPRGELEPMSPEPRSGGGGRSGNPE